MVPEGGAIVLDELFEIDTSMQAELLRVLQERKYRRLGEVDQEHPILARILAATHQDPAQRIADGALRVHFLSRVSLMKILTPSLRERLDDRPEEVRDLTAFIAGDLFGLDWPSADLVDQVEAVVKARLPHHPWPGNMRELATCVSRCGPRAATPPAGSTPSPRW